MPASAAPSPFRLRVVPSWESIEAPARARVLAAGLVWPSVLHPARWPRGYAATCSGTWSPNALSFDVALLEPPNEPVKVAGLTSLEALSLSFGVASKRAFLSANPETPLNPDAAAAHLDAQGLFFPALAGPHTTLPTARLVDIPLATILSIFHARASGSRQLTRAGTDHLIDKYAPLPELQGFALSHWRGEPFFRLTHPSVRVEVEVQVEGA